MKKHLLLAISAFTLLFNLHGQIEQAASDQVETNDYSRPSGKPIADASTKAAPFWTEDFGAGMPTDWAMIDSSGICPWVYSTDGSWGNFNGNNGTAAGAGISSTTSLNGFLICDPDSANHATYGQPSGTTYQYLSSYFITSSIDCSGHSSVILSFEQLFRYNNGVALNVLVSNDSITWTGFDVSNGLANNTASQDPDVVNLNITNIAANQSTVYIKIGWSARVYYWMIDDISLREAEANDLAIGDNWWGTGMYQNQYYKIPTGQLSDVTFYTEIYNNTGGTLVDVYSDVTVTNTGGVDFTGTSSLQSLAAVEMDTFTVSPWLPSQVDLHTIDYTSIVTGQTDGDPSNNDFTDEMEITTSIYGLDNLQDASESTSSISNFSSNTGQPFRIGNIYEIIADDGIQCLEIGVADEAQSEGMVIFGEVHVWDPINEVWEMRGFTDAVDLVAADLGTIMSVPLVEETMVYAGEEALVVAGHYGGAGDGSDDVNFMYGQPVENYMVYGFNGIGDVFWLTSPRAIVVRADFDCGLNVDELNSSNISIYPSPVNSELTIDIDNLNKEVITISLIDLLGKEVLVQDHKVMLEGLNSLSINTANLSNGVYNVVITDGDSVLKEKIVVAH